MHSRLLRPKYLIALAACVTTADAQTLTASIITPAGGTLKAGCLSLETTLGEPITGRSSGGDFVLTAGYIAHIASAQRDGLFHDGFQECSA